MKRGIIAMMIMVLTAGTAVYGQISFSAWGRGVVTPLAFTNDDDGFHSAVSAVTYTSSDTPSIGFTATGIAPSGMAGFKIDLGYGGGVAGIGDNAKVWVKPFEVFTLTAGLFKEEDLRGKIGASEFAAWLLPNSSKNEDNIFQRFDAVAGAHFKLDPLAWLDSKWNGLTIQGAFGSNTQGALGNNLRAILNLFNNEDNDTLTQKSDESRPNYEEERDRNVSALDVFKAMQIAIGYRIPDVGLARFQFIGSNRNVFRWSEEGGGIADKEVKLATGLNTNKDADIIEAAFLYDGLEGLKADVGVKLPLEYETDANFIVYPRVVGTDGHVYYEVDNPNKKNYTVQQPLIISAGVSWTPSFFSALSLTARVDVSTGGKIESSEAGKKVTNGMDIGAWFMPSYTIFPQFKAGVDIGLETHALDTLWEKGLTPIKAQTEVSKFFDFGIGPWAELAFAGGRVKTGVVIMMPGTPRYNYNPSSTVYTYTPKFRANPVISIPVSFTYSF